MSKDHHPDGPSLRYGVTAGKITTIVIMMKEIPVMFVATSMMDMDDLLRMFEESSSETILRPYSFAVVKV